jgi:membrane protein DedA with SNARE-associated domain
MSGHEIHHLIHVYGCAVVFTAAALQALGAPVPGTTVLVAAAVFAAASHGLPIAGVIASGAAGVVLGSSIGFAIGRRGGVPLLMWVGRRLRQSPARVTRLRTEFAHHGAAWVLMGRFITGVRNVTGLLAGASGMPAARFLLVSSIAAVAWASLNALEYYWFGRALAGASTWVAVLLVGVGLAWMALSLNVLRRRATRRLQSGPEWESESPAA